MSELRSCGFGGFDGFELDTKMVLIIAVCILLGNPMNIVDEAKCFLSGLGVDYTTLIWIAVLYFVFQNDIF